MPYMEITELSFSWSLCAASIIAIILAINVAKGPPLKVIFVAEGYNAFSKLF
jgi:3'-phosphoadenosine 5'-phosphosulfate sulfotransferase (PAPS reductase)/FAD synthetase